MGVDTSVQETLMENCTLWAVPSSGWAGTDKLTAEDLNKSPAEIAENVSLGTKKLLPYTERVKLNRSRNKIATFMRKIGKPFLLRGVTIVPNKNLAIAKEGLDRIILEQEETINDFLSRYHEIKTERITSYPNLIDAKWLTPEEIKKAFKINVVVFEISNAEAKRSDPDELIALKEEYTDQFKNELQQFKELRLSQAYQVITETCQDIADRVLNRTGKLTTATLKKQMKIIKEYEGIAELFDLDSIKEKVAELKIVINNASVNDFKHSEIAARNFANAVKTIGEDISILSVTNKSGQTKRIVKIAKAA
jgi:hypothetical protein